MTERQARILALRDRDYFARKLRGQWVVWDDKSDHAVDFDYMVDELMIEDLYREKGE